MVYIMVSQFSLCWRIRVLIRILRWVVGEYDEELKGFLSNLELELSQEIWCLKCLLLENEYCGAMGVNTFYGHHDMRIAIGLDLDSEQKLKIIQLLDKGISCNSYLVQAFGLLRRDLGEIMS